MCNYRALKIHTDTLPYKKNEKEVLLKRRNFLILGSLVGFSASLYANNGKPIPKALNRVAPIIAAVQEIMFPKNTTLPSAKEMDAITFLLQTVSHPTYDKDIRAFVIEGAKELQQRETHFLSYTDEEKEKALRRYEQTGYGSNWLSRIMVLSMEAIFSDPIYGSNINERGWKAVRSFGGQPRPKTRYIEL